MQTRNLEVKRSYIKLERRHLSDPKCIILTVVILQLQVRLHSVSCSYIFCLLTAESEASKVPQGQQYGCHFVELESFIIVKCTSVRERLTVGNFWPIRGDADESLMNLVNSTFAAVICDDTDSTTLTPPTCQLAVATPAWLVTADIFFII